MRKLLEILAVTSVILISIVGFVPSAQAVSAEIGHGWAGLEVSDLNVANVWGAFGSFVVPSVTCAPTETSYLSVWVGIGGARVNDTLYQSGINANCIDGVPKYWAFYEKFATSGTNYAPDCLGPLGMNGANTKCFSVEPGDTIAADVVDEHHHIAGSPAYTYARYSLSDIRGGKKLWSSSKYWDTDGSHSYSAECVAEDTQMNHGVPDTLADFSAVVFSTCQSSDAKGELYDMSEQSQPHGWNSKTLNMKSANDVLLTDTTLSPLTVTWVLPSWSAVDSISKLAVPGGGGGAISCPSTTFCMADPSGKEIDAWNGRDWFPFKDQPSFSNLISISCTSTTFCVGVGSAEVPPNPTPDTTSVTITSYAVEWNGAKWDRPQAISSSTSDPQEPYGSVKNVSCSSPKFCMAIGYGTQVWNGVRWSNTNGGGAGVDGGGEVSCASSKFCMDAPAAPFTYSWNGSVWSQSEQIPSSGLGASAVACTTLSFCLAATGQNDPAIWNGTAWTSGTNEVDASLANAEAITCTSTQFCVAMSYDLSGPNATASEWNGTGWTEPQALFTGVQNASPNVSCATSSYCMAVSGNAAFLYSDTHRNASVIKIQPGSGTPDDLIDYDPELQLLRGTPTTPNPGQSGIGIFYLAQNCSVYLLVPGSTSTWFQSSVVGLEGYLNQFGAFSSTPVDASFLLTGSPSDISSISQVSGSEPAPEVTEPFPSSSN
jgi:hypothetical protein